jgi:hypothetical protein
MQSLKFVHWQDGDDFLVYSLNYSDYWPQDESPDELKANLIDLHSDLTSWQLHGVRKIERAGCITMIRSRRSGSAERRFRREPIWGPRCWGDRCSG